MLDIQKKSFMILFQEVHPASAGKSHSEPEQSRASLKVSLLASEWRSSKGGVSTINRKLAIHLAEQSTVEVTLLVPQNVCSEEDRKKAESCKVDIVEVQCRTGFNPLDCLISPPKNLTIDVLVGHGVKLGKQAQFIKESHGCKWVQVVHTEPEELGPHKKYSGAIAKAEEKNKDEVDLCNKADLVVTIGPKLQAAFSSQLRSTEKHHSIFQLTPGTFREFSDIKQVENEISRFKVLTFGRSDPEDFELKGYDIAAKAIAHLADSSYRLIFVGASNGKQDEIAAKLLQYGISKTQLIVRRYAESVEELKAVLREADLAIMPSRTEGFGLTALEALSAGLPILVSSNSGLGETLLSLPLGKSFVVASEDPKEWANKIAVSRRKKRKQRLEEMQTLRTSYEEKFSWEEQCKALVDRMRKIAHGKNDLRHK